MKNVFLSIVIICALAIAGIGGTLAGFSDTERSLDNFFEVGNMDLKVSVDGIEYDDPVPAIAEAYLAWPCNSQDFSFDLHNLSDNVQSGHAYVRFKDFRCYEVYTTKFPSPDRPEPEEVAENGGWLANKYVEGMGPQGQICNLADFVEVMITYDGEIIAGTNNPWGGEGTLYLSDLLPPDWEPGDDYDNLKWIYLGDIPGCNTKYGDIALHISDWSEEMWNDRYGTDLQYFNDDLPFDDWLTNLFQNDGVNFVIEFGLTQDPIPADFLWTPEAGT